MPPYAYRIRPRRLFAWLLGITAVLLGLHVLGWWLFYESELRQEAWFRMALTFVDLDDEASFGTWFNAFILLLAGVLLFAQARAVRAAGEPRSLWWRLLGIGFVILSIDEIAQMHEAANALMEGGQWWRAGAVLAGVVGLAYLPFLARLPLRTCNLFLLAGALYVGGAVGVEWATYSYEEAHELDTLAYNLWNTVEEGLEIVGVSLFVYALASHMAGAGAREADVQLDVRP
jgi:hypothetical protein